MTRSGFLLGVLLVSAVAFGIYSRRLDVSPPAQHPDELSLSRQAAAVAETGRDVDGARFPLYFRLHDNVWTPPVPVYVTALVLKARASTSARVPTVLLAVVDIALLAVVALRLFHRAVPAIAAAALLALTPSHFINSRVALPSIYPLAFELVWLIGLFAFVERRERWLIVASTMSLGLGFYAHPVAVLMMPAFLVVTLLTVRRVDPSWTSQLLALAAFAVPLVVLLPWFARHHDMFRVTLGDWGLHALANPRDGLHTRIFNWTIAARRLSIFWDYFSPSYLFLTGGADLVASTQKTGLFLGVVAVPLAAGVYDLVTRRWNDPCWRLVGLGFVLAPLGAAMFEEPRSAGRALVMLPFGILIAIAGFEGLMTMPKRAFRYVAIAIIVLIPLQFSRFYRDYFSAYPQRAAAAFPRSQ